MNKKFSGKFSAKGYYIALILCAAAIGISGYLYYRNITQENPQLQDPTIDMDVLNPSEDANIPVVGPNGDNDPNVPDAPSILQTCLPVQGQTITEYAMQCLSYNPTTRDWRTHDGIDLAAEAGTGVKAAPKIAAGFRDGFQLRVGQGGLVHFPAVAAAAHDFVATGDDTAYGDFPVVKGFFGQFQRFFHELFVGHAISSFGDMIAYLMEN